jgi:succinate dehydrogenase/fumarate reductase flavoprotein subunit
MDWEDYIEKKNTSMEWPYPVDYDKIHEVSVDVVVLGGGPAGMMAAISIAKKGLSVAVLDKAHPKRSGGGSGCDHWLNTPNPASTITPEDCVQWEFDSYNGYSNSLSRYIAARESYDTLLEIEKMGAKIRDIDDEFRGAPFRDEKTKLLFCYDYENRFQIRVWGTTFKPAMYQEAMRLGVQIFDRVYATSLLTEGGKVGTRVVGATGVNNRTGEFYLFRTKAAIDGMSRHQGNWMFSTELTALPYFRPNIVGDGPAILWRAGAVSTMMEKVNRMGPPGYQYPTYGTGNPNNTWFPCTIVDADGKEVPWVDANGKILKDVSERTRPAEGQKFIGERALHPKYQTPHLITDLPERIRKGEFKLPLYADLTSMPWYEREAIWGLMVGQEGRTRIPILQYYNDSGFDPSKDMLQSYYMLSGESYSAVDPNWVVPYFMDPSPGNGGGAVTDWALMSNLPGLFVAGDALFASNYYYHACVTGRYAGRHAAEYVQEASEPIIDQNQVERERNRVYAPTKVNLKDGIDWKEFRAVCARVMQNYCGELRNEELLNIGLVWLDDLELNVYPKVYARNPHEWLRVLESYNMLTCDKMIIHVSLARKASSDVLSFYRQDYPEKDPPDWHKFVTIKMADDGKVEIGEKSIGFWGNLQEEYEAHNKDYRGFLKKQ